MASYSVQAPSGKTYTVEGPDGATADQLGQHILSQVPGERTAQQNASFSPTADSNFGENVIAGTGRGVASVARAVGLGPALRYVLPGLPADQAEAAKLDAPLLNTAGGKIGNVVGQMASVAPAMFVPGANTYAGAGILGATLGAGTTEGDLMDRARGALYGGVGGVAGQGLGSLIGMGADKLTAAWRAAAAARQAANAGRDSAVATAQAAGYKLPPTQINPTVTNSVLEGLSGKIKTSQAASTQNQPVTNQLVRDEFGLAADKPISREALANVRNTAGQAYEAVRNAGTITPGPAYDAALDNIVAPYVKASQAFPGMKPSPVVADIEALRSKQFDADSAVSAIRVMREKADAAFASGDKAAGKSLKAGATALEDAIDSHLVASGAPADTIKNFRDARQTIAKTYTADKALNPTTGDIDANKLGAMLQNGKPLSGNLLTVGQVANAFPKATQALPQAYNAFSPLDFATALLTHGMTGDVAGYGALLGRPAVRSVILSAPYQKAVANGVQYEPNALKQLLGAGLGGQNRLAPLLGATLLPPSQQ